MVYYNGISSGYNELHGKEQLEKARLIKKELNPGGLLLDVGAGTGVATKAFEGKAKCIALEPGLEMLSQYSGLKVCAKAERLPFKDKSFDSVVSITVLHHANLEKAFSEIKRVAKPNASIAISFFKRAKNLSQAERLFSAFRKLDAKFDWLFLSK